MTFDEWFTEQKQLIEDIALIADHPPTAAEVGLIRLWLRLAWDEGHTDGYSDGYSDGYQQAEIDENERRKWES